MSFVLYYLDQTFSNLGLANDMILIGGLFTGIFLLGVFISWISTFFATHRFLSLNTDELYY